MIKKVLGFDISSSCIGWCLLQINESTKDVTYLDSGLIKPIKHKNVIERLVDTKKKVLKVIEECQPDYIGIEDIISFIRNKSSANTIITLAVFNRMIGVLSFDFLKKSPGLFGVLNIRHGLKMNKIFPKKEDMPELVAKHLGIKFPYEYIKKGRSKGKPHVTNFDRADGIAVALYYSFVLTGKVKIKT